MFIFIPIFLPLIVKKPKSEVIICEDDFTVHINKN